MHAASNELIFSATDLSAYLGCARLTALEKRAALGGPKRPVFDDPSIEVLRQRGHEHEAAVLANLKQQGKTVFEVRPDESLPIPTRWQSAANATATAMAAGADVIYQGVLFDGTWLGKPDFLLRVETPSSLGGYAYEVIDAKLAREAKGGALLQVLLYADLLKRVQGTQPEHVHLALGGPEPRMESFRVAEYAAYFRSVRARFLAHVNAAQHDVAAPADPVEQCGICAWSLECDKQRRAADHLSLVAGIHRRHRDRLGERGVTTLAQLATLPLPLVPKLEGVSDATLARVRHQAAIQLAGREADAPRHELLPVTKGEGLASLPEPSPGDLFFDLESDAYALTHGIEYLFGWVDASGAYTADWALDRASEKAAFERFIDLVMRRLEQYPDMHVYHYAAYEPTALKRLVGRYGTREEEVDRLLRGRVLVDLCRAVKQGLRASVESYSIKSLEPHYGFTREVDLRVARNARAHFEAWLELGGGAAEGDALRDPIQGYNRDDCISTLRLRDWLEQLRAQHADAPLPRPEAESMERSEEAEQKRQDVAELVARLTHDVPIEESERSSEQHARWLAAQMLDYHRREQKAMWWEYFRCLELSDAERIEDRATLGGLEYVGEVGQVKKSTIHRYRFPQQEHPFGIGDRPRDADTEDGAGEILALDDVACTLDLKRGNGKGTHPRGLVPLDDVRHDVIQQSLMRLGREIVERGLGDVVQHRSAARLLLRVPPRVGAGAALLAAGESTLAGGCRIVSALDGEVLAVQGPPGSGKTFTAARMIVHLLAQGKRVGVTGPSHKVIGNLLGEVCRVGRAAGTRHAAVQKADEAQWCKEDDVAFEDDAKTVAQLILDGEVQLAAGTPWLWSREELLNAVDVLFIDEAGQVPLANTLACAAAASSLVLLGDPRQLEQPQQGVHPPGAEVSALDWLLAGEATIAEDRGLFLAETWRLHPDICAFTSELFYENRLLPHPGLDRQRIDGERAELAGSGLRVCWVEHTGNQGESEEEADAIAALVRALLAQSWRDREGASRPLTLADILVVAPYNAQVALIRERLPDGARVGTVDKFQGQEAPVVIYSMTTSSPEDAPRGMSFLYSPNRLNVATSRARCLVIVVASPLLFAPECRSPEQMRLANAVCRYREVAGEVPREESPEAVIAHLHS